MPASPTISLDLPQKYLELVKALLRAQVPHLEVWAYGSRVTGSGHEASDLDLVLRNPQNLREETAALYDLKEAFTESNLPIRVDVMDWARIPASFHSEIERAHVVVQEGGECSRNEEEKPHLFRAENKN
jgi:predicted nucleotidyltransferase